MIRTIPLFPLQMVAFPGEVVNLHIFEPRYRTLFHDLQQDSVTFGIVPVVDNKLAVVGTEMRLLEVAKRYADGKLDVRVKGLAPFNVKGYNHTMQDKPYPGGEVSQRVLDEISDINLNVDITYRLQILYKEMQITNVPIASPKEFKVYQNVHKMGLSIDQEIELLQLSKEVHRQQYVVTHLEQFIASTRQMKELHRKAQLNGHFQDLIPPDIL